MNTNPIAVQWDYLDVANSVLDRYDSIDNPAPGILELTGSNQARMATSSGLNDCDYQSIGSLSIGQKELSQVKLLNRIHIPTEILDHFNHIKCHCMMGLFPQIGRAWLTIDSEIYIWTYEHAKDVAFYDGLNQLITGVGLIKPKPRVFVKNITHLLVICTASDIIILGITFGKESSSTRKASGDVNVYEEMHLLPKPVFFVSSEGNPITVIKGTKNGRIFLGGKDGCLYEITYKAESSWFGSRCKKVNHSQSLISYVVPNFLKVFSEVDPIKDIVIDDERNLLFVLTEKSCIEAWDLGPEGNDIRRITRISSFDISFNAAAIIRTIDPSVFKTIKAICVIGERDCSDVNFMAVTQCGVRLYFSTLGPSVPTQPPNFNNSIVLNELQQFQNSPTLSNSNTTNSNNNSNNNTTVTSNNTNTNTAINIVAEECKNQGIYLRHVRLPPGYTPNSIMNRPRDIHFVYYKEGTTLMATTPQQEQDILWAVSSAPFPNRNYLIESTTLVSMDGIVYDIAELKDSRKSETESIIRKAKEPSRVTVLTNEGVHILKLLKPIDILQQLLVANKGPHHESIKHFFQTVSESEGCATCLLLSCSEQFRGTDVALWASQAFMMYGGDPCYYSPNVAPHNKSTTNQLNSSIFSAQFMDRANPQMYMSTPMPNNNPPSSYILPQTPIQTSPTQRYSLSPISSPTSSNLNEQKILLYSYRHDGLYLHVSRLLRPVWKKKCLKPDLTSSINLVDCSSLLYDLTALKEFFEANSINDLSISATNGSNQNNLTTYTNGGFNGMYTNSSNDQRTLNEKAQAEEKRSLMSLSYFIKYVCEGFALWMILLENGFDSLVRRLTKEQQVILRNITYRDLVFTRYDVCAWLIVAVINSYLNDNASVNTISSKLRKYCPNMFRHEDAVTYKATELLIGAKSTKASDEKEEKLHMALKLCKDSTPNLPLQTICQQFTAAGFYKGVIELCSAMAAKCDPEEYGIHHYKSDEPSEDRDGCSAYVARLNIYKEVRNMLDYVYQTAYSVAEEKRKNAMNLDVPDPNSSEVLGRIITMAIQTKDPILHTSIYEWLLTHNMVGELLSLSEPSLGEYLRKNVMNNPKDYRLIDLLWKYYEKNGHHIDAAKILDNLATLESHDIDLGKRIEYLARAVMCMRNESLGYSVANGILLKELEDRLEIARVQKSILDSLQQLPMPNSQVVNAIRDLNYSLFDISHLYEHFADRFNLWDCKLRILNCSNHNDPLLVETVWSEIINSSLEGCQTTKEQCLKLFTKMEVLFKEFKDSGHCFPLAFLIKYLEIKACQLRFPPGIVPEKLIELTIDVELLMEYYLRMISMNERVWTVEGNEWHLVDSAIHVVSFLSKTLPQIWNRNKRRILLKGQDVISSCLTLLYQKPGTERLQHELKEIQAKLQRALI